MKVQARGIASDLPFPNTVGCVFIVLLRRSTWRRGMAMAEFNHVHEQLVCALVPKFRMPCLYLSHMVV